MKRYRLVDLKQNTKEWESFRKDKIGASDIPCITGTSPWSNQYELWKDKNGLSVRYESEAMRKGKEKEAEILQQLQSETNIMFKSAVIQQEENPWAMASLDGLSTDGNLICELKCLGAKSFEKLQKEGIPVYYQEQMLWQMFVSGLDGCIFYAWHDGKGHKQMFEYNAKKANTLFSKAEEFYEKYILGASIPDENEIVPVYIEDQEFKSLEKEYITIDEQVKELERKKKELKHNLMKFYEGMHIRGEHLKIFSYERKGSLSESLIEKSGLDPDSFRSSPTLVEKISRISDYI